MCCFVSDNQNVVYCAKNQNFMIPVDGHMYAKSVK